MLFSSKECCVLFWQAFSLFEAFLAPVKGFVRGESEVAFIPGHDPSSQSITFLFWWLNGATRECLYSA